MALCAPSARRALVAPRKRTYEGEFIFSRHCIIVLPLQRRVSTTSEGYLTDRFGRWLDFHAVSVKTLPSESSRDLRMIKHCFSSLCNLELGWLGNNYTIVVSSFPQGKTKKTKAAECHWASISFAPLDKKLHTDT